MQITFTQTRRLSEDGFAIKLCEAGRTYDLAENAALFALRSKWAIPTKQMEASNER